VAAEPVDTEAPAQPADTEPAGEPPVPAARVGPHLAVVVHGDGRIVATVDADPEQITLEELALVAEALAQAAGTADVTAADEAAAASGALETAARTLRDQGVATTTAAFRT
jgi:NCAIR mutase (PurE)-related protein